MRAVPPLKGEVIAREEITPNIVRVRARGEEFKSLGPFAPGQHLDVLVHRIWPFGGRHYTPTYIDRRRGEIELIVHLYPLSKDGTHGPGSAFFERLKVGERLTVWGPGGAFTLRTTPHRPVFVGDETTLASYVALNQLATERELPTPVGVISVGSSEQRHVCKQLQLPMRTVVRGHLAAHEELVLEAIRDLTFDDADVFYLAGRIGTIQAVRTFLRQEGVALSQIRPKGFWTEDSRGL